MAVGSIEFVENENLREDAVVDETIDALIFGADGARGIDDVDNDVDTFQRVADLVVKFLHELARLRFEQAGRVDEHDLAFGSMDDAVVRVACGLRFRRNDGDLGAHQGVEERRFADVGATDQHGETGFEPRFLFHGLI